MEITMCCLVDEDLAWCLLQSVQRKSSHSGHQVAANLDSLSWSQILEVTKNAKSSTAIVHIERDLEDIDAAFEKMKSDITNNITEIDEQKRKILSDISSMRKSFNDHLDKIEKRWLGILCYLKNGT
jgi:chromosome segregation ATPase